MQVTFDCIIGDLYMLYCMNVIMNVSVEKKMDLANRKLELMCGELIL